jgi:hypothetical protein
MIYMPVVYLQISRSPYPYASTSPNFGCHVAVRVISPCAVKVGDVKAGVGSLQTVGSGFAPCAAGGSSLCLACALQVGLAVVG